jgi:hypothetical protein
MAAKRKFQCENCGKLKEVGDFMARLRFMI